MSPLSVFVRTLLRSSALFLGTAAVFLHPPLDWSAAHGLPQAPGVVEAQQGAAEAAVDGLVAALKDADPGVRRTAAGALGQIGAARAVPGLVDALKDRDADVRSKAVQALGEIGDGRNPHPHPHPHPRVRLNWRPEIVR